MNKSIFQQKMHSVLTLVELILCLNRLKGLVPLDGPLPVVPESVDPLESIKTHSNRSQ